MLEVVAKVIVPEGLICIFILSKAASMLLSKVDLINEIASIKKFENAAELGRIGKYYAVEDMLTTDPDEKFGTMTLQEHYDKIAVEGQEYDPYATMFATAPEKTKAEEKDKIAA